MVARSGLLMAVVVVVVDTGVGANASFGVVFVLVSAVVGLPLVGFVDVTGYSSYLVAVRAVLSLASLLTLSLSSSLFSLVLRGAVRPSVSYPGGFRLTLIDCTRVCRVLFARGCRGRLNVLANVLRKPMPQIFKEFQVMACFPILYGMVHPPPA